MSHPADLDEFESSAQDHAPSSRRERGRSNGSGLAAIRVVVAEGTRMGSQLISDALKEDSRFAVVGICATSRELQECVTSCTPDVVVVNVTLDEQSTKGFEITRQLRTSNPETKVILLLDSPKRDLVIRAFGSGAKGVFCRAQSIDMLRKCICIVQAGQVWASSEELHFVLDTFADNTPSRLVDSRGTVLLSKREQDVVRCVTEGLTNKEIAQRLKLSEHTVKNYIFRIFDKLGVSTRVEMVLYAFSQRTAQANSHDAPGKHLTEIERHRRRAEDGVGMSQYRLGEMYRDGRGAARNKASAYLWFLIAQSAGRDLLHRAQNALDSMDDALSADEIAEAQRKAAEWLEKQGYRSSSSARGAKAAD
jgi:DNA-binding NarL/FixJ family response regulator